MANLIFILPMLKIKKILFPLRTSPYYNVNKSPTAPDRHVSIQNDSSASPSRLARFCFDLVCGLAIECALLVAGKA